MSSKIKTVQYIKFEDAFGGLPQKYQERLQMAISRRKKSTRKITKRNSIKRRNPLTSKEEKIINLIRQLIISGVSSDVDNYGQIIIYTGLKFSRDKDLVFMSESDFDKF